MEEPRGNITKRSNRPCFSRRGRQIYTDFACFPDNEHSVCCQEGDACMSNGLCRAPGDLEQSQIRYTRGSCTDETCKPPRLGFYPFYTAAVSEASTVLIMPSGGIPWEPSTTSTPSSTSTSSSTPNTSSEWTSISSPKTPASSEREISTPTGNPIPAPTAPPDNSQSSNSNTLPIGLGAGIGGGVFAFAFVLLGVWFVRRRRAAQTAPATFDNVDGGGIYESPRAWESQPFVVDNKPPIHQGGWQTPPPPFPFVQAAELASGGQGRIY
ncbi:hypothetical protein V8F20_008792 [Naviculisporaceae sp. PSN 640]